MILAEDELGDRRASTRGIMVLGRRAGRRHAAGRRRCRSPTTSSSSRSRRTARTASASTASRARCTPRRARRWRRAPWARIPARPGYVPGAHVRIEAPDLCPRFTARVFENVTIGAVAAVAEGAPDGRGPCARSTTSSTSPTTRCSLTGHPLHAFDLDRVAGGELTVRRARDGEQIETLDGADPHARRRDGASSRTPTDRRRSPASWAARARRSRDGHHARADGGRVLDRAEHPPHVEQARRCAREASGALREGPGARAGAGGPDRRHPADARADRRRRWSAGRSTPGRSRRTRGRTRSIRLRDGARSPRCWALVDPARRASRQTLDRARLRRRRAPTTASTSRVPPFRRNDVTREADLDRGGRAASTLDKLPGDAAQAARHRGADVAASSGCAAARSTRSSAAARYEIVGWSFTEPGVADRLRLPDDDPRRAFVALQNPMSEDHSVLRTTRARLAARRRAPQRRARQRATCALLEQGAVYVARRPTSRCPHEHRALGARRARPAAPRRRGATPAARGRRLLRRQGPARGGARRAARRLVGRAPRPQPFLHPGRSADGRAPADDEVVGWVGELHPLVARAWELDGDGRRVRGRPRRGRRRTPSRSRATRTSRAFPPVRQDLAVVVADDVAADDVLGAVARRRRQAAARRAGLRRLPRRAGRRGAQVAGAARSTFQAPDRTLTDEDVAPVRDKIVAALAEQVGGELRG